MALSAEDLRSNERFEYEARSYGLAFFAGVLGAMALTILMSMGLWAGWAPFRLEMLLGSLITGRTSYVTWLLGFGWHLINGGLFGVAYNAIFRKLAVGGAEPGMALWLAHWIASCVLLNLLFWLQPMPAMHWPERFFWWGSSGIMLAGSLALHLLFGAIVGLICKPGLRAVAQRPDSHPRLAA